MTWETVDRESPTTALLPVGSTEQHGPHLPLNTDTRIAETIATTVAETEDVAVLPTVPYGSSAEHMNFPGTLSISSHTLRSLLRDILESAEAHGIQAIIIVNGHGGNMSALKECCAKVSRKTSLFATAWTWWNALERDNMGHAGKLETSLMLHLDPDNVHEPVDGAENWGERKHGSEMLYDVEKFAPSGAVGNAQESSDRLGRTLFENAVEQLHGLVSEVRQRKVE